MPVNIAEKVMSLAESVAIKGVLSDDSYLTPYKDTILNRFAAPFISS